MPAFFHSRMSSAVPGAILLALIVATTAYGGTTTSTPKRSPGPSIESSLPTLYLDGGPPRALDNLWLGYTDLFLEVNASLTHILPNGRVAPDLATWTISKDRLVYTFTIRRNARFSNGHPVTAQDAAFSLQRFLTPSLGSGGLAYFGLIRGANAFNAGKTKTLSGVRVLNRRTLQVTITKPAVYLPMALANYSAVFDPAVVAGKAFGYPADHFVTGYLSTTCTANQGAGPFRLVCHDGSSTIHSFYSGSVPHYTLEPNPFYYGHQPHIRLDYRAHPAGPEPFLAGQVDISYALPPPTIRWRREVGHYHEFPSSAIEFLTPNVRVAPFNDIHCRLAVAYALDRGTVTNQVLNRHERPVYTVVPAGMLAYYTGNGSPHFDLSRARSEIAACPARATPVILRYPESGVSSPEAGRAIARMLARVGFNIALQLIATREWDAVVTHPLAHSKTQIVLNAWAQDYADPQDYLDLLLRSGQRFDVGGWHDATYDRLVDRANVLVNPRQRAALYIQAQRIALSQGAFIAVSSLVGVAQIKPYVYGLVGTEAYPWLMPRNFDWSSVSIGEH